MINRMVIREVRAMLERHWTEIEIAHRLWITQAEVQAIIATLV